MFQTSFVICETPGCTRNHSSATTIPWTSLASASTSTSLTLCSSSNVLSTRCVLSLSTFLIQSNVLTSLRLDSCGIGSDEVDILMRAAALCPTLTHLNLSQNPIGANGAKAIGKFLMVNTTLTSLSLDGTGLGDRDIASHDRLRHLQRGLVLNETLQTLHIDANCIGDRGAELFHAVLALNSGLTSLFLGRNIITSAGAKSIAIGLPVNKTLMGLFLSMNAIRDNGAESLVYAISHNQTLKSLDMMWTAVGAGAAMRLTASLRDNVTMTWLQLDAGPNLANAALPFIMRNKLKAIALTHVAHQLPRMMALLPVLKCHLPTELAIPALHSSVDTDLTFSDDVMFRIFRLCEVVGINDVDVVKRLLNRDLQGQRRID